MPGIGAHQLGLAQSAFPPPGAFAPICSSKTDSIAPVQGDVTIAEFIPLEFIKYVTPPWVTDFGTKYHGFSFGFKTPLNM